MSTTQGGTAPSRFPTWLAGTAATLTQDRFAGPEWVFERNARSSARRPTRRRLGDRGARPRGDL